MVPALAVISLIIPVSVLIYLVWRRRFGLPPASFPRVLAYHKVTGFEFGGTWITPGGFISQIDFLNIRPLWGAPNKEKKADDALIPYYWGYDVDGKRLSRLDDVLLMIDGSGPKTEVDLYFLGERNLILVESKRKSGFGRCSRFTKRRCPEMHLAVGDDWSPCRYWEVEKSRFTNHLAMRPRPKPDSEPPTCNRHYQLARTLTIGRELADLLEREFHLWVFAPRSYWSKLEKDWLDFAECVQDDSLWRRLRVIAWEDIQKIAAR